jgi:hypothetical protein
MMGGDRVDDAWRVDLLFLSSSLQWLEEMMGAVVAAAAAAAAAAASRGPGDSRRAAGKRR